MTSRPGSGKKSILRDTGKILAKPGKVLLSMKDLAENAFYSLDRSEHITAEVTNHCKENTYASGCTFADITVDMEMGTVKIDHLVNVHDSGTLLNPQLAEAQSIRSWPRPRCTAAWRWASATP